MNAGKNKSTKRERLAVTVFAGLAMAIFGAMFLKILDVEFSFANIALGLMIANAAWMINSVVK